VAQGLNATRGVILTYLGQRSRSRSSTHPLQESVSLRLQDFSCQNALLTEKSVVKICDFGGARLDENESDGVEEPRYELPLGGREWEARPYIKRDLFALGSSIYELMAWKKPFAELSDGEVEKRFDREEFPDVSNVLCTDIVRKCWNEEYERAEDVMLALQAAMSTQKDWKAYFRRSSSRIDDMRVSSWM
jgi:serine/threonine protein kinase